MIMKTNVTLAPIVLFVYNRPWHTRQTVEALQKNELAKESVLYVFADGPKSGVTEEQLNNIKETREYVRQITGFKEIHIEEAEKNKGLANSIISGISKVINQYGKVIVVEDDLVTHKYFLRFINDALSVYEDDMRLFMVTGCNYNVRIPRCYRKDVYLAHRSGSTGWGTWKNRWDLADWDVSDFDTLKSNPSEIVKFNRGGDDMMRMLQAQMDGKIDSWAIRWDYCMYKNDAYCIRPVETLVNNIGFDGTGVHSGKMNIDGLMAPTYSHSKYRIKFKKRIKANPKVEKAFWDFNSGNWKEEVPLAKRVKRKIKRVLRRFHVHSTIG